MRNNHDQRISFVVYRFLLTRVSCEWCINAPAWTKVGLHGAFSRLARPLQHQRTLFNGEMQKVNRPRKEGPSKNVRKQWVEKNGCSGVHVVVAKESEVTERMQVESKYKEMRHASLETGGRELAKGGGGGGGQAGQHKLSLLGQGPMMSPGGQGSAVI